MYGLLNVGKTGMSATQNKVNIISNNIVNVNTTGYKKLNVQFQDLVRTSLNKDSYPTNNTNTDIGSGVKTSEEVRIFTQGSLRNTELSTNLAIDGTGFFRVVTSDGSYAYTRNGEFNVDASGKLVDSNGNVLDIQFVGGKNYNNSGITTENLTVNKAGDVLVNDEVIGKINLYTSSGNDDFISMGDNLFTTKPGVNVINADGNIMQGYIEMSNVDLGQEMTELITAQRSFQLNSKGITVADEMWSMINNLQSR